MVSAAKKDQSMALVLHRMEEMGLGVNALPKLKEKQLQELIA